jgi:GSH-dependent disulfide-bond oxidoreductase
MIDLHYTATPNGQKITLMLEEAELAYRVISYDIFEGDQLTAALGQINPNHKLPAIVDTEPDDGPEPLAVFESGAILQYLAEKTGRFLPTSGRARSRTIQWLTWQVAGLGPMGGQASHFLCYAPAGQDYAIERYSKEFGRLLRVLEGRLNAVPYLAGDEYSIADIAVWRGCAGFLGGRKTEAWPAIRAWFERVAARPAARRILARADLAAPAKYLGRKQVLSAQEWSNMFGERMHAAVSGTLERG